MKVKLLIGMKKGIIFIVVLVLIILIVWFFAGKKQLTNNENQNSDTIKNNVEDSSLGATLYNSVNAGNPTETMPETNPFKKVEINPYNGAYTNPFN